MAKVICPECGDEMEEDGAWGWTCPGCGLEGSGAPGDVTFFYDDSSDIYGDKPECCYHCDSDMYPACKDGCNMIDD